MTSETREMSAVELVETFERETGEPTFRAMPDGTRVINVSEPHPGIVPTWPRLILERGRSLALSEVEAAVTGLRGNDAVSSKFMPYDQMTRGGALDDVLRAITALREGTGQ